MMSYLVLRGSEPPWGDYGDVLVNGMSSGGRDDDGLIKLERTAPFIPPITFPGIHAVVVTDQLRSDLLSSGLTGLGFAPVVKAHIVRLDWRTWSTGSDEPPWYPESGEPEDYIFAAAHDDSAALALGPLWELTPDRYGTLVRTDESTQEVRVSEKLPDFFTPDHASYRPVLTSPAAQTWLDRTVGQWISLKCPPIPLVGA